MLNQCPWHLRLCGWSCKHFTVDGRDAARAAPHGRNELPAEVEQRAGHFVDIERSRFSASTEEIEIQKINHMKYLCKCWPRKQISRTTGTTYRVLLTRSAPRVL